MCFGYDIIIEVTGVSEGWMVLMVWLVFERGREGGRGVGVLALM